MGPTEYDCQQISCGSAPDSFKHDPDCMYREGPYCLPSGASKSTTDPTEGGTRGEHCC